MTLTSRMMCAGSGAIYISSGGFAKSRNEPIQCNGFARRTCSSGRISCTLQERYTTLLCGRRQLQTSFLLSKTCLRLRSSEYRFNAKVFLQSRRQIASICFISMNHIEVMAEPLLYSCPSGQPLSVLDGVPIAVKDEIDCLPYATTGTRIPANQTGCVDGRRVTPWGMLDVDCGQNYKI